MKTPLIYYILFLFIISPAIIFALMIIYNFIFISGFEQGCDTGRKEICKNFKHYPYIINNKFQCRKDKL